MTNQDPPGVDWNARHAAAGTTANQQHPSQTTADGPIQQHQHPMNDSQILGMIENQK
jgi:hypothetical protein